jgi:type II secretory pathway pseudopilin PulG
MILFRSRLQNRGFTVIEALTAFMILSVLVRIAIPYYQEFRLEAEASRVAGDVEAVRQAAAEFRAQHQRWPRDMPAGRIPPEMEELLPPGFSFRRGGYQIDWDHWVLPDGLPGDPEFRRVLGISVVTPDRALGAAVRDLLGSGTTHFSLGDTYTFLLPTPSPPGL